MYMGVDLGSTNIKAALYDKDMNLIDRQSRPVTYITEGGFVEFNAEEYFNGLIDLLAKIVADNSVSEINEIAFTGQAESLVVVGVDGGPLMNAISWMDDRSSAECEELSKLFPHDVCEAVTGQMAVLPTWPATKILWLKHNRPEIYNNADCYMLLKDYIVYRITGKKLSDMSIATFSFYFDIYNKCYWKEMLDAVGITEEKLPPLCEPCSVAGDTLPEIQSKLGLKGQTRINVGTLDHFTGMIGTGNIGAGGITLSTGTVMALATMCGETVPKNNGMAVHYGFKPDTYILLPVAESGGVSLEWFHRTCMKDISYACIDAEAEKRRGNQLIFLPYLVGTNAPEFDSAANGVFWGLRQEHDAFDMALAVMEGVSCVLRKNCDRMADKGVKPTSIIATGGGSKSAVWCQLQADFTGLPVRIPKEREAACLGAAMIAAVSDGRFESFDDAAKHCVSFTDRFDPNPTEETERKYRRFCALYDAALKINNI